MQAKVNTHEGTSGEKTFNFQLSWEKGNVISIDPESSLREAASLMREHQVGDVLVMDQNSKDQGLLGIITDRDIALALAEEVDFQDLKVGDIMSESVVCATNEDDFFKLVSMMNESGVTRLPIMDNTNKVVGVVTAKNLLELLVKSLFEVTQISERQQENERNHQH